MTLSTVDGFVKRVADGFYLVEPWQVEYRAAGVQLNTLAINSGQRNLKYVVPSMPAGVSSFILMRSDVTGTGASYAIIAKMIDMGSLNIGTNVFTDGNAMPTLTELGVSRQIAGAVWIEVDTALNATPGTLTVTYKDQDGNTAEVSPSFTLGASVPVRCGTFLPLNSPDVGVTDITAAARAAGTTPTGVLHFWGLIPIGAMYGQPFTQYFLQTHNFLGVDLNPVRLAAGDTLMIIETMLLNTRAKEGWLTFVGDT